MGFAEEARLALEKEHEELAKKFDDLVNLGELDSVQASYDRLYKIGELEDRLSEIEDVLDSWE